MASRFCRGRRHSIVHSVDTSLTLCLWLRRHSSSVDDPYLRTKWNKCKKDLMEEFNIVKQIDAERQAFRETPGTTRPIRPSSPQITVAAPATNPYFPVEEIYVSQPPSNRFDNSRSDPMDDPDVWRPPSRDIPSQYGTRRPTKAGQMAAAAQAKRMAAYARGAGDKTSTSTSTAIVGRSNKVTSTGPSSKSMGPGPGMSSGVKGSSLTGNTGPRKSTGRSTPSKRESLVRFHLALCPPLLVCCFAMEPSIHQDTNDQFQ